MGSRAGRSTRAPGRPASGAAGGQLSAAGAALLRPSGVLPQEPGVLAAHDRARPAADTRLGGRTPTALRPWAHRRAAAGDRPRPTAEASIRGYPPRVTEW